MDKASDDQLARIRITMCTVDIRIVEPWAPQNIIQYYKKEKYADWCSDMDYNLRKVPSRID